MFVKNLGCPVHFCIKRKFCGRVLTSFCIVKCIATFSYVFKSNGLSLRVIIPQTSGFHYSIAHSLVTLETKFYVNDVIIASVTCIKLAQAKHQLSPTAINSRQPVHCVIPIKLSPSSNTFFHNFC